VLRVLTGCKTVVPIVVSVNFNRNYLKSNILPRFSLTWRLETDKIFAVGNKSHIIFLGGANEQEEMSQPAKKIYADEVEKIVKFILKKYDWTKNHKLTVQYI
jgi:hypothetical protein